VTSNKEQEDNGSGEEDLGTYTDQIFDDYDYENDEEAARRRTDLVFHGLIEGLHGMTDRQLVEWVLETGLELDSSQYIEEVDRFGLDRENQVRPIRVKAPTVEKRNQVLRREKMLRQQADFRRLRIYIQPWLSRRQQMIAKELRKKWTEMRRDGYRNVAISRDNIVQHVNGKPDVVLYTART